MTRLGVAGLWLALAALPAGLAADEPPPSPPAAPRAPGDADLEELVRSGGRFRPDYVPREPRSEGETSGRTFLAPLGRLILLALDARPGSLEAEVYGGALREVGEALVRVAQAPFDAPTLALRIARRAWLGAQDPHPERARAHATLLGLVLSPAPGPVAAPPDGPRISLGGALLTPGVSTDGAAAARVVEVSAGSPADRAGLRAGDSILRIAGAPVRPSALAEADASLAGGAAVLLAVEDPGGAGREVRLGPEAR